ncbi:LysR family transcriptional regulator [Scandinavium manionii]|uniref:LysR family transcriptional regulator n=1 Tax=Scandinavium manionii TaxID=2926520 RepID=UPI001359ACCF|nr:LysR family transcriptional regulator [Scandinavium manionii]MCS2164530.1 LysR family transcriptional regulator [Scandinavium manionii]
MIEKLDLKVLRAVHILCEAGSVNKAAEILDVTPGAVTYLINKARKETGSTLFIRTKSGMMPDTVARELSARYLGISHEFSKNESGPVNNRPMVISAYSLAELLLSLVIFEEPETYPELIFRRQDEDANTRIIKLRNREVDLDIGTRLPADSSINQLHFFAGNAGILIRRGHPTIKDKITLQDWQCNTHAVWLHGMHFTNDNFELMHKFNELSLDRNVAFRASSSLNLVTLCMLSDILVLVPEIVGRKLTGIMPVDWFSPPEELNMRYECYIHYHRAMSGHEVMHKLIALFNNAFDV